MIGNNIKRLRTERGMTQKALADKLFVSAQAVSRWENNEVEPSITTLTELAKIFGVSADEILGLETKKIENEKENKTEENGFIFSPLCGIILKQRYPLSVKLC